MTMLFRLSLPLTALIGLLATAGCHEQDPTESADHPESIIAEMNWLAGTWSGDMWGGRFEAHYSTPDGGRILSHSRLFVDGEVGFFEFEVFEPKASSVFFQPYPGGVPAIGLTLVTHDAKARRAVFENSEKDFPTRIVYERVTDDQLVITLSDPHGGTEEKQTFKLSK
ncbi:MAG: hypothetical protein ACI9C2_002183 [Gammaproteobacteria bacterium]|jgi:hypothetical protein